MIPMSRGALAGAALAFLAAGPTVAQTASPAAAPPDPAALIDDTMIAEMRDWLGHEVVTLAVVFQNRQNAELTQSEIDALDQQWRAETDDEGRDRPLIARVMASPLSGYLIRHQAQSLGLYPEIFVMDSRGLNVGQSSITSDYWQGDEAKFQETFLVGPDALFVDEPEFNDTTNTWRAQVNMSLTDPDTGTLIGAATVEVDLDRLAERKAMRGS